MGTFFYYSGIVAWFLVGLACLLLLIVFLYKIGFFDLKLARNGNGFYWFGYNVYWRPYIGNGEKQTSIYQLNGTFEIKRFCGLYIAKLKPL